MPFCSKHALLVTKSDTLADSLEQNGHSVSVINNSDHVLPFLIANPHIDLLVLDQWFVDIDVLLKSIFSLSVVPTRIVVRANVQYIPHVSEVTLITLSPQTSDIVLNKTITESFASNINDTEPKKRKILIIDDVQDLLDMYSTMFRLKWYDIETAIDGLDGIAKASSYKPDIILLDIMMPHMDGYEMMHALYSNTSLTSVVVVNSNIEGQDVVQKVYESGADYYLRKSDFTPSQIVYMVEKWLFDKKRNKTEPIPTSHFHPWEVFFSSMNM